MFWSFGSSLVQAFSGVDPLGASSKCLAIIAGPLLCVGTGKTRTLLHFLSLSSKLLGPGEKPILASADRYGPCSNLPSRFKAIAYLFMIAPVTKGL